MRYILLLLFSFTAFQSYSQVTSFPYIDNFDGVGTTWAPEPGNNVVWERSTPATNQINSAFSGANAWVTNASANYSNNRLDFVQSPLFNFSSLGSAPYVRFKYNMKTEACCDNIKFQYTLDDQNWVDVGTANSGQNWFNDSTVNYWSGNSNGWKIASHRLDDLPQSQNIRFRFLFFSDYSINDEGFAFDDFEIVSSYTDAELDDLISPSLSQCAYSNAESISVRVENLGQNPLNSISISYQIDSNNVVTETINQIAAETNTIYTFNQLADLSADTTYNLKIWINAGGDNYSLNDSLEYSLINLDEIDQFPFFEDFEAGQAEWTSEGQNNSWSFGTPNKSIIRGAASGQNAWVTGNTGFGFYNNDEASFVLSPCFNSSALSTAQIRMRAWWESESNYDGANIQYSTNDGSTWQNLNNSNSVNGYNNNQIEGLQFSGSSSGWSGNNSAGNGSNAYLPIVFNENQMAGHPSLRFRINFGSDGNTRYEGFAFDDFFLGEAYANDLAVEIVGKDRFTQCGGDVDSVFVILQNAGTNAQSNFNIHLDYNSKNISSSYSGNLAPGSSDTLFAGLVSDTSSGDFDIKVYHDLASDAFNENDTSRGSLSIYAQKAAATASNVQVCDSSRALLSASGAGFIRWYADSNLREFLFAGDTFLTSKITSDTTFYISNSVGSVDTLGPSDRNIGTGSYSNVSSETRIEVNEYMTLLSAKIYVINFGTFDVSVEDQDGNIIRTKSFDLSGGQKRINLDFELEPGQYNLIVENISGLSLYRNTSGADYSIYNNSYFSILGNSFDPEFYYYLYDFRIAETEPCQGISNVQVTRGNVAPIADYSFDRKKNRFDFFNRSQSGESFEWIFENLSSGNTETSSDVNPSVLLDSGNYNIYLIANSNCGSDTILRSFTIDEISVIEREIEEEKIQLSLYPNPAHRLLNWRLEENSGNVEIRIFDSMGKELYRSETSNLSGRIDLGDMKSGYYLFFVTDQQRSQRKAFIIQ